MKTVKFFKLKLISLFTILFTCIALCFTFAGATTVSAEASPENKNNYFEVSTSSSFNADGLKVVVEDDSALTITNRLAIDDLALSLKLDANVDYIKLSINSNSFDVNGNEVADGQYEKNITNVIEITVGATNSFKLNGGVDKSFTLTDNLDIGIKVINGVLTANVEGEEITNSDAKYKVENIGIANGMLSFNFGVVDVATDVSATDVSATLISVDQKALDKDEKYKQSLAVETVEGVEQFKNGIALPRVAFTDSIINSSNQYNIKNAHRYDLDFVAYSLFGGYTDSDFTIEKVADNANIGIDISKDNTKFAITNNTDSEYVAINVKNGDNVVETYNVYTRENDNAAPIYNSDAIALEALESFKNALLEATKVDYDNDGIKESVRVGGTVTIPSLHNLIVDQTPYESMSHKVYVTSPSKDSALVNDWTIEVDKAGEYMFYVIFEDDYGNSMQKEQFVTPSEDDNNVLEYGEYKDFIFTFVIEDNAPISVEAVKQGKAYLNVPYSASPFDIQTSGYTASYSLYYNADINAEADDENWYLIPEYRVLDEYYKESGWTYQDLVNLNYDRNLSFTPIKEGAYKIECTVSSTSSVRYGTANSIIKVTDKPVEVVVPSTWLKDNALSVVFLSVGTLCLAGIIALLFVKPKEKVGSDEE